MRQDNDFRISGMTRSRARAIAIKAESDQDARRMEFAFLVTAMAVFITTAALMIKFSFC